MRSTCLRCRRPESACYCASIPSLPSRTRVLFLQHPRERRVAIGTARMAHLALPNSELHVGIRFDGDARLEALADSGRAAVLFPGEGAHGPELFDERALDTLVVLDGTWPLARKLLKTNAVLRRFPRIGFSPRRPGNYRIRKEPAEHCLSTVEAVAEVLAAIEGRPGAFDGMLAPFDRMVDHQLGKAATRTGPPRRKERKGPPPLRVPRELWTRYAELVLFYAESNAHPADAVPCYPPELIHLVALRPATGERFESVLRPGQPLAACTPHHLQLPAGAFEAGEPRELARERFTAFLGAGSLLCSWGGHSATLVREAGFPLSSFLDLRRATQQLVRGRTGALETLAQKWQLDTAAWASGRAGRRIAQMTGVLERLRAEARAPRPPAP